MKVNFGHEGWIVGAMVVTAAAFFLAGLNSWGWSIVGIGVTLGIEEAITANMLGGTLSQKFTVYMKQHPKTAWLLLAIMGGAFAILILHLAA